MIRRYSYRHITPFQHSGNREAKEKRRGKEKKDRKRGSRKERKRRKRKGKGDFNKRINKIYAKRTKRNNEI
ncbi:MAG: hypothetical protein KBA47_00310 [Caldisericia bacterium]|nr:hypothetical protein [Caldisericia bacterium]